MNDIIKTLQFSLLSFFLLSFFLLSIFVTSAYASVVLPSSLQLLDDEAFEGCKEIKKVEIGEGVTIGEDVFNGAGETLLLTGRGISTYALAHNYDFSDSTVCRALLIGQSAYSTPLYGPLGDIQSMESTLTQGGERRYEVTKVMNLTGKEILSAISTTFALASPSDISLVYYSGHGNSTDGALVGIDRTSYVTATQLRTALDQVPGRKVLIIDACYSGALIGRGSLIKKLNIINSSPDQVFMNEFFRPRLFSRSNLAANCYYVVTSASGTQQSFETTSGGKHFGLFTYYFCRAYGYDYIKDMYITKQGDSNGDGIVSFDEAYVYAGTKAKQIASGTYPNDQSSQVYPEECVWFGVVR